MSGLDAAELARLRSLVERGHYYLGRHVLALLDALEEARGSAEAMRLQCEKIARDRGEKQKSFSRERVVAFDIVDFIAALKAPDGEE